ncbi:hypothetical protein BDR04DRAFT_670935 [Suillus decipiens]|nr:hypothetical protein BDR04DRAFT_670935 [Suillus decipiens]
MSFVQCSWTEATRVRSYSLLELGLSSQPSSHHPQATTKRPSGSHNPWQNNPCQHQHRDSKPSHDSNATYDHPWERARAGKYSYYQPPPGTHSPSSYTWSHTGPFSSPHIQ